MSDFAVVITTGGRSYTLDAVADFSINTTSDVTTHPMVGGDTVGDHMIKMPTTISVSGSMSLQGSTPVSSLASIQKIFEDIKNNGSLCTVAKVKIKTNELRFLKRSNMVLTGITWIEKVNGLDYTFAFTQILLDYSVVKTSASISTLPDIVQPSTLSFEGTLISKEDLYQAIIQALVDSNIVDQEFLKQAINSGIAIAGGALILTAIGLGTGAIAASAFGAAAGVAASVGAAAQAIPVAGQVIGIVIGAALLAWGAYNLISESIAAANLKYKAFKADFSDYEEQRAENERFAKMMDEIYERVNIVNDYFKVYSFNANCSQEAMINIGGVYHVVTLNKANNSGGYTCKISAFDSDGEVLVKSGKPAGSKDTSALSASNAFCSTSHTRDGNAYNVYFLGDTSNLLKASLLVASIDPSEFNDILKEIIESALNKDEEE